MYTSYFGFREEPFNVTPDPRFFVSNPFYQEAWATLLYGIRDRKGFIVLIGEAGTGKTTLLHKLMDDLDSTVRFVFFYNTSLNFDELLTFTCEEFGLEVYGKQRLEKIQALNSFLITQLRQGCVCALLIDEAQNLTEEVLEDLRLLSNLEIPTEKLLQIVLVGQPELQHKLDSQTLRQLKQRVVLNCRLERLRSTEVGLFVEHRLKIAGCKKAGLFTASAIRRIAFYSDGLPRSVNVICDNALLLAYAKSIKRVSHEIIDEVATDLRLGAANLTASEGSVTEAPGSVPRRRTEALGSSDTVRGRWQGSLAVLTVCAALIIFGAVQAAVFLYPIEAKTLLARAAFRTQHVLEAGSNQISSLNRKVQNFFVELASDVPSKPPSSAQPTTLSARRDETQENGFLASEEKRVLVDEGRAGKAAMPHETAQVSTSEEELQPMQRTPRQRPERMTVHSDVASDLNGPHLVPFPLPGWKQNPVMIEPNATIYRIVGQVYGFNNFLAMDLIKQVNPHIEDLNRVRAGLKLWLPPLTPETLIRKEDDGFRVIVAAMRTMKEARELQGYWVRKGYSAAIDVRPISDDTVLHRVTITGLKDRKAANTVWAIATNDSLQAQDRRLTHGDEGNL